MEGRGWDSGILCGKKFEGGKLFDLDHVCVFLWHLTGKRFVF